MSPREKATRRSGAPRVTRARPLQGRPYRAYAVAPDGSRRALHAERIVVDVGGGAEIEIALAAAAPPTDGRLRVTSAGLLVVHPGGGNVLDVSVEPMRATRRRSRP